MTSEFSISSTTLSRSSRNMRARIGCPRDLRYATTPAMIVFNAPKTVMRMCDEPDAPSPVKAAPRTTWDKRSVLDSDAVSRYVRF
jgi:hypothetical protein